MTILPLKQHQVDDYLAKVGPRLATVREVLRNDIRLQKLMTTPLMLNIVTLAYQDCSVTDLVRDGSVEARRQQIFEV